LAPNFQAYSDKIAAMGVGWDSGELGAGLPAPPSTAVPRGLADSAHRRTADPHVGGDHRFPPERRGPGTMKLPGGEALVALARERDGREDLPRAALAAAGVVLAGGALVWAWKGLGPGRGEAPGRPGTDPIRAGPLATRAASARR
jgi:hypothetical protein